MTFTLGSITCPACTGALELRTITTTDDGLAATGALACPDCNRRINLAIQIAVVDLVACPHDGCPRTFESRHGLTKHQRSEHPAELPTQLEPCPACGDLVHPLSRHRHLRICAGPAHEPDPGAPAAPPAAEHVCPECGAEATSARGLAGHLRTHEVPVPCTGGCGRLIKPSGQGSHARTCTGPPPPEEPPAPCPPTDPAAAVTPGPSTAPPPPTAAAPGPTAPATKRRRPSRSTSRPPTPPPDPDRFRSCGYTPDPTTEVCGADELMFDGPRQRWRSVRLEGGRTLLLCPDHATIRGPGLDHSIAVATRSEP